ncbi:MAG: LptF/LptG family permease, partial [Alphaproteobacteria bacterium]|nr:LptF/LptG family permease [Alphaproteobacteria bacterium]
MKQINLYIMRQLVSVTVFATIVLCVAVMLVQSVRLVDLIVNRGLPLPEFGYMASLMIPRFVALVMPIALFGAMLFTYNRMINDSELI